MARRFELGRIGYRGDNSRGGNTADPRDGGETPAGFIAAVPGSDRLFDLFDPFLQIAELIGHRPHGDPCFRQDARVGIIIAIGAAPHSDSAGAGFPRWGGGRAGTSGMGKRMGRAGDVPGEPAFLLVLGGWSFRLASIGAAITSR
jgi:hypothetical protein